MERAHISLLTVCGLEELDHHRTGKVTHVLSIIDPGTPDPESFAAYGPHHRLTLRFHDIIEPLPGQILPEPPDVERILAFGDEIAADSGERTEGHLLIHCHMGISRSSAAMAMLLAQASPDEEADSIVRRLVQIRPQAWPNLRMVEFADGMLGRQGTLAAAVSRLHARQIADKPHLADVFRRLRREREVDLAARAMAA